MELAVYNISGKKTTKKVKLNKKVFGVEPNNHAIYLDVKQYLANQRQGTHKSKERGEITGSTRKIKKQKGTGTARAGSIKNPLFRSGGRVFGPQPRNYGFKLNKKVKRVARASALTLMAKDKNIDKKKREFSKEDLERLEILQKSEERKGEQRAKEREQRREERAEEKKKRKRRRE